jgi:hypothetical protein
MDVLEKAVARRAALVAELAKLDNWIQQAKELMEDASALHLTTHSPPVPPTNGDAYVPNKTIVLNACRELIAERKAMPLKALLGELEARGINPGTRTPSIALSVMLSRSDDFKADRKKGGWTLAKGNAPSGANH